MEAVAGAATAGPGTGPGLPTGVKDPAEGQKAATMEAKLAASAAAHQATVDRRRLAAKLAHDPTENVDAFLQSFESELSAIKQGTVDGEKLAGQVGHATEHFEALRKRATKLNERLSSASMFLPPFQLRQRQLALAAMLTDMEASKARAVPKKKFSFAKRGKAKLAAQPEPELQPEPEATEAPVDERFDPAYLITHQEGAHCAKVTGEINGHDYAITDVSDCTIYLLDLIGALYIKRAKRCRIVTGPIRGSVHITGLEDCSISLAARQIRMHTSTSVNLHVFCASDPIIEHCNGIGIGPYVVSYPSIEQHTAQAGLDTLQDRRTQVQDFNWLRQIHSPNWFELDDNATEKEAELRQQDRAQFTEAGHSLN
jgi:hypothetical protein